MKKIPIQISKNVHITSAKRVPKKIMGVKLTYGGLFE